MIDSIVEYVIGLPLFWNALLSSLAFISPFALVLFAPMYLMNSEDKEEEKRKNIIEINLSNGIEEIDEDILRITKQIDRVTKEHNELLRNRQDLDAEYFEVNTNSLS